VPILRAPRSNSRRRLSCTYNANKQFVEAATDRMGFFRLTGLPPGLLRFGVVKNGYGRGLAEVPPDAYEVDITLAKDAKQDD
jgi:hypothetical protein